MHRKYMRSWNPVGSPNNILIKMLLENQILNIRCNNLLVARYGSKLLVVGCFGGNLHINHITHQFFTN